VGVNLLAGILSERDSLEDKDEILSPHIGSRLRH